MGYKEIQRVMCSKSNSTNTSDYMVFEFLGALTDRVYVNYGQAQIKAAIEANPYIGNVSVYFPNYSNDSVTSACWPAVDADWGGFTVQFDTEFGDLPMLDSLYDTDVVVKEMKKGQNVSKRVVLVLVATGLCLCRAVSSVRNASPALPYSSVISLLLCC
jgi:hypothetical protein